MRSRPRPPPAPHPRACAAPRSSTGAQARGRAPVPSRLLLRSTARGCVAPGSAATREPGVNANSPHMKSAIDGARSRNKPIVSRARPLSPSELRERHDLDRDPGVGQGDDRRSHRRDVDALVYEGEHARGGGLQAHGDGKGAAAARSRARRASRLRSRGCRWPTAPARARPAGRRPCGRASREPRCPPTGRRRRHGCARRARPGARQPAPARARVAGGPLTARRSGRRRSGPVAAARSIVGQHRLRREVQVQGKPAEVRRRQRLHVRRPRPPDHSCRPIAALQAADQLQQRLFASKSTAVSKGLRARARRSPKAEPASA